MKHVHNLCLTKETPHPSAPTATLPATASVCAVAAVCASALMLGIPLHNTAHGMCPRASAQSALVLGGEAGAGAGAGASAASKALEAASQKLLNLEGEVHRRNAQLRLCCCAGLLPPCESLMML